MSTIEALLFDLGRVIIDVDMARSYGHWGSLTGLPIEQQAISLLSSDHFHRHERGEISDTEFFAHLRHDLAINLGEEQFIEGWNAVFVGEMPGIRALLQRAQSKLPLYAFSNTNPAHQTYWSVRFAHLLAPFRKIYVSHELGARKPEIAAYEAVIADMGVPPHRILFFDDNMANVVAARACGMQAVEVLTIADIAHALGELP
jgi:glucose-1-phosphatase